LPSRNEQCGGSGMQDGRCALDKVRQGSCYTLTRVRET
jgi:hypothetical protein